jgi:hypothetical protein
MVAGCRRQSLIMQRGMEQLAAQHHDHHAGFVCGMLQRVGEEPNQVLMGISIAVADDVEKEVADRLPVAGLRCRGRADPQVQIQPSQSSSSSRWASSGSIRMM